MWQAEADTELALSASPTTAVGHKALALAKRRYSTVLGFCRGKCVHLHLREAVISIVKLY